MHNYLTDCNRAAKDIQRLLLQNKAHNYIGKQTRGKLLDLNNVAGIMTHSSNIRKRKIINDQADYELCLVLDLSGSISGTMRGPSPFDQRRCEDGINNCLYYAWLLSKVFISVLGKHSVSIYGFNLDFLPLKELLFQHRFTAANTTKILANMAEIINKWCRSSPIITDVDGTEKSIGSSRWSGNHDGYYLLKSVEETVWTNENPNHRIVIHFSDGQPLCNGQCGMPGCAKDRSLRLGLHNAVKKLRQSGYVCIGVGLGFDGVEEYYGDLSVVAKNPAEMYSGTIDILRKQMKRGTFR